MSHAYERDPASRSPVAWLARRQHGIVTRAQLVERGWNDSTISRRIQAGAFERIHNGVYRLGGAPPTWRGTLLAACFAWGAGAVISHRSAAALHRLSGFDSTVVEVTVPAGRNRMGPGIVHRSILLDSVDVEIVDAIPVTTVARTLIDLAGLVSPRMLGVALDDALYRNLVSKTRLRWRLGRLGARRGVSTLRNLVEEREGMVSAPQSPFETMLLDLVRHAGLPIPETQYAVRAGATVVAIVDFAYPQARVAIEADGRRFHSGRADFERDRERANALVILGWRVVRVTWTTLTRRPADVVRAVATAVGARTLPFGHDLRPQARLL